MENTNKLTTLIISFVMILCSLGFTITVSFAWFNGEGYMGKTMSYSRTLYIGATSSQITNYYGYIDTSENFIYTEIDPLLGFQYNNLIPSSYVYLRSDITNTSLQDKVIITLYLQNVEYDAELNDFLYFGTSDPDPTRNTYKNSAIYNSQTDTYKIESLPLISRYEIEASETLSLYWFVHIDSDATMAVAQAYISLGELTIAYNS